MYSIMNHLDHSSLVPGFRRDECSRYRVSIIIRISALTFLVLGLESQIPGIIKVLSLGWVFGPTFMVPGLGSRVSLARWFPNSCVLGPARSLGSRVSLFRYAVCFPWYKKWFDMNYVRVACRSNNLVIQVQLYRIFWRSGYITHLF